MTKKQPKRDRAPLVAVTFRVSPTLLADFDKRLARENGDRVNPMGRTDALRLLMDAWNWDRVDLGK